MKFEDVINKISATQDPNLAPIETFRGKLQHYICARGLSKEQAKAIVAQFEAEPGNWIMVRHWTNNVADYSPGMWAATINRVRLTTIEWLIEHEPLHWVLPVFRFQLDDVSEQAPAEWIEGELLIRGTAGLPVLPFGQTAETQATARPIRKFDMDA